MGRPLGEELAISGLRWVALEGCGERQALIQSSAGFPTFAFEAENSTPHRLRIIVTELLLCYQKSFGFGGPVG
ncbi:hypothetical protein E5288_WYG020525 [Bos mutus]|uniref:Uncharacterized protein n=1 Tax=Bos mutus TaxID=72004 RepID=A0A6B0RPG0_9CETA|nr:hypothetical protein [Bos mutus]